VIWPEVVMVLRSLRRAQHRNDRTHRTSAAWGPSRLLAAVV